MEVTLSGRLELLRELPLGMDVFERGSDFDPRLDPIVRIDARRLRARLADYYQQTGAQDEVEILLDRGGYVPSFRLRQAEPAEAPVRQMTVMPFESWNAAADDQHSGRVLTEGIVSALGQIPGWRVRMCIGAAPHSAATKGSEVAIRGGIMRQGKSVRVFVNIVDVSDGSLLDSQRFDRHESQGYELQEDVIRYVVKSLGGAQAPAGTAEGLHFYLQGRYLMNQDTPDTLKKAIGGFQKVVEKDPNASRAWAGMAAALNTSMLLGVADPATAAPEARRAARKALHLEPDLAEARSVLAAAMVASDDDPAEARRMLESVITEHPHCTVARVNYAVYCLLPHRRFAEARNQVETAITTDPGNLSAMFALSLVETADSRLNEARILLEGILKVSPDYPACWRQLSVIEELAGNHAEALAARQRFERIAPYPITAGLSQTCRPNLSNLVLAAAV